MSEHQSKAPPAPTVAPSTQAVAEKQTASAAEDFSGDLEWVGQSFMWLYNAFHDQLDILKADIDEKDQPSWVEQLAETILEVALSKATAGLSNFVVGRVASFLGGVPEAAPDLTGAAGKAFETIAIKAPNQGGHEVANVASDLFAKGLNLGVKIGKEKLRTTSNAAARRRFIDAQRAAVWETQSENQQRFLTEGRRKVTSKAQAVALSRGCSQEAMQVAAGHYYEQMRDAWVSYVAQQKYGGFDNGLTNMESQERRDADNKSAPGWVPGEAPTPDKGMRGQAHGVLEVWAELPATNGIQMNGSPNVKVTVLGGVNDIVRAQYSRKSVSDCAVPRQVTATVAGDHPSFTVTLDEEGPAGRSRLADSGWLIARATVGHPEHFAKNEAERREIGLQMLLKELITTEVVGRLW